MPAGERRVRCALCMLMGRLVAWPRPLPSEPMLLLLGERARPWEVALANGEMPGPSCTPAPAAEAATVPGGGVTRPVPPTAATPGAMPSARAFARCDLMACSASASTFLHPAVGGQAAGRVRGLGRRSRRGRLALEKGCGQLGAHVCGTGHMRLWRRLCLCQLRQRSAACFGAVCLPSTAGQCSQTCSKCMCFSPGLGDDGAHARKRFERAGACILLLHRRCCRCCCCAASLCCAAAGAGAWHQGLAVGHGWRRGAARVGASVKLRAAAAHLLLRGARGGAL